MGKLLVTLLVCLAFCGLRDTVRLLMDISEKHVPLYNGHTLIPQQRLEENNG